MEKDEIIRLYLNDLCAMVTPSPARNNRIEMLKEELERTTSDNSEYVRIPEPVDFVAWCKRWDIDENQAGFIYRSWFR